MLKDKYGRTIDYLRISVTDRCNYRCQYCMPEEGVSWKPHSAILRYEQVEEIARAAARLGIKKIRLTGGEPLIKRGIEHLVGLVAAIPGIEELSMTTNGSLLTEEKAVALKAAGLARINISLDTLDPDRFSKITRGGKIDDVLRGIRAALSAGLLPVKINMVVFPETTPQEIEDMEKFCVSNGLVLQKITEFSLLDRGNPDISHASERPPKCVNCNRIRLTADGQFKPCLFSENEIKADFSDMTACLRTVVAAKPKNGAACRNRNMCQIGG